MKQQWHENQHTKNKIYLKAGVYFLSLKQSQGWSQDGGIGRHRVRISPQLGHLPDAGGGPRCPRRWEEPASKLAGHGGTEGRGEVEAGQDWHLWGVAGSGGCSYTWRDPHGLRSEGVWQRFPMPNQPGKFAQLSGQVLRPQRMPPGRVALGA